MDKFQSIVLGDWEGFTTEDLEDLPYSSEFNFIVDGDREKIYPLLKNDEEKALEERFNLYGI
mgnify:CR=1 FL=1